MSENSQMGKRWSPPQDLTEGITWTPKENVVNLASKSIACLLLFTAAANAGEPCEWVTQKSLWLHEMRTKYRFPMGALSNFVGALVQDERSDSLVSKAKLEGILLGTVESLFDPETVFLVDGTFSSTALSNIFYEACEEAY